MMTETGAVQAMPCLVRQGLHSEAWSVVTSPSTTLRRLCGGHVVAVHVTARGMGGAKVGRFDLVPLCEAHHREAGEARTSQRAAFERRYGLDLRAEADRIAVEHEPPIGIRGLAQLHVATACGCGGLCDSGHPCPMAYNAPRLKADDLDRLLGWVSRECEREVARRRSVKMTVCDYPRCEASEDCCLHFGESDDCEAIAAHIAERLGITVEAAKALVEQARRS